MTPATRSLWVNWSLVVIATALAAVVFLTSGALTSSERSRRQGHLIVAYRSEVVRHLAVTAKGQTIALSRSPDPQVWMLKDPDVGEGEVATVDQLLKALSFATWLRKVPAGDVDRLAFGLENPQLVIEFDQGTNRYRLKLGGEAKSPPGARYLELSGAGASSDGVYVVTAATARELQVEPQQFRVRSLVPYSVSEVRSLSVQRRGESHTIKHSEGFWQFDGSLQNSRLDRFIVDRLFLGLSRLQAENFLTLLEAERLQAAAAAELLTLALRTDGVVATYRIGAVCPSAPDLSVVIRRQAEAVVAACAPASDLLKLTDSPPSWTDRKVFQSRADEVEEVRSVEGQRRLEFARREDGFVMRQPTSGAIEPAVGNARVAELTALSGELVSPELWRAAAVSGQVSLQRVGSGDQTPHEERVSWSEVDGRLLVRRESDQAVLQVPNDAKNLFAANALLVRSRQLLDLKPDQIRRVVIGRPEQEIEQVRPGLFELRRPPGHQADGSLAAQLFSDLSHLTAERWIAELASPGMGLDAPNLVVIEPQDADKTSIQIGARAPGGGYYGRLQRGPEVFTISAAVVKQLTTLLVDRSAFDLDLEQVESLKLRTGAGVTVEFLRVGGQLIMQNAKAGVPQNLASEVLAALSELRAEVAVSVEPPEKYQGFEHPVLEAAIGRLADTDRSGSLSPPPATTRWQVGAGDTYRGISVYYARVLGNAAIFAVPRERVQRILDLLE